MQRAFVGYMKEEHLAVMRDREGYMAELRNTPGGVHELIEFNCPIFQIAALMGEACDLENSLFRSVLGVQVDSTHKQITGVQERQAT